MKVDFLFKKPGAAVTRVYKGARNAKRLCYAMSSAELVVAGFSARHKDILNTGLAGFLGCYFLKYAKDFSEIQKIIEPEYKAIVERAKLIKNREKTNAK